MKYFSTGLAVTAATGVAWVALFASGSEAWSASFRAMLYALTGGLNRPGPGEAVILLIRVTVVYFAIRGLFVGVSVRKENFKHELEAKMREKGLKVDLAKIAKDKADEESKLRLRALEFEILAEKRASAEREALLRAGKENVIARRAVIKDLESLQAQVTACTIAFDGVTAALHCSSPLVDTTAIAKSLAKSEVALNRMDISSDAIKEIEARLS